MNHSYSDHGEDVDQIYPPLLCRLSEDIHIHAPRSASSSTTNHYFYLSSSPTAIPNSTANVEKATASSSPPASTSGRIAQRRFSDFDDTWSRPYLASADGLSGGGCDDGDSGAGSAPTSSSSPEEVFQFSPSSPTDEGAGCADVQADEATGEESGFEGDFDRDGADGGNKDVKQCLHQQHQDQDHDHDHDHDSVYGDALSRDGSLVSRGTHPLQRRNKATPGLKKSFVVLDE